MNLSKINRSLGQLCLLRNSFDTIPASLIIGHENEKIIPDDNVHEEHCQQFRNIASMLLVIQMKKACAI